MINVKFYKCHSEARIPVYMSAGASGCDVYSCHDEPLEVLPGVRVAVPTGLIVEIPKGYEIQVRPRSGLAFKKGLTVVNAPGTIDSDYRGEIKILMINLGTEPVLIEHGDRVAQLVLASVDWIHWDEVKELYDLKDSDRGTGGFGSTDGKEK